MNLRSDKLSFKRYLNGLTYTSEKEGREGGRRGNGRVKIQNNVPMSMSVLEAWDGLSLPHEKGGKETGGAGGSNVRV